MKRSIILPIICALLLNSAGSIHAIGIAMTSKIQDIIRDINKLQGSVIINEIKALRLIDSDMRAPIISGPEGLNAAAYQALRNQGFTLNSMQVVQDIRKGIMPQQITKPYQPIELPEIKRPEPVSPIEIGEEKLLPITFMQLIPLTDEDMRVIMTQGVGPNIGQILQEEYNKMLAEKEKLAKKPDKAEVEKLAQKAEVATEKANQAAQVAKNIGNTEEVGRFTQLGNMFKEMLFVGPILSPQPEQPGVTPQPTPAGIQISNADLKYFSDLIDECKKNPNFFKGFDRISKAQPQIPSSEIHRVYTDKIIKNWKQYTGAAKTQLGYVLNEYLNLNYSAFNKILAGINEIIPSNQMLNSFNQLIKKILTSQDYWYLNYRNKALYQIVLQISDIKNQIVAIDATSLKPDALLIKSINENINTIVTTALIGESALETQAGNGNIDQITAILNRSTGDETTALRQFLAEYSKLDSSLKLDVVLEILTVACYGYDVYLDGMYTMLSQLKTGKTWTETLQSFISTGREDYAQKANVIGKVSLFENRLNTFLAEYGKYLNSATKNNYEAKLYDIAAVLPNYVVKGLIRDRIDNLYNPKKPYAIEVDKISPNHKKNYSALFVDAYATFDRLKTEKTAK